MKSKILTTATLIAALCFSTGASAEPKAFEVNGDDVSVEEQKIVYDALTAQGNPANATTEEAARRIVIERKVLASQAEDERLDRDDSTKLRIQAASEQVLRNVLLDKWRSEIKVDEKEIRDRYEAEKRTYGDTEFRVAHILVKTEKEGEELLKQLDKNPKDFEKLAKEKSLNATSAAKGGELGWIVPAQVERTFSSAFVYLKPGSIAQAVVRGGNGFNVVKLLEKRKALNFPKYEQRKEQIKALLTERKLAQRVTDLVGKAKIEY